MALTPQNIRDFAPELVDATDYQIAVWLNDAETEIGARKFGTRIDTARLYFVCHQMVRQLNSAAVGGVTEEHVGPAGQSFASPIAAADVSGYKSTSYGQRYWQMCRSVTAGGIVVT